MEFQLQGRAFTRDEYSEAKKFLGTLSSPYVLKADGLAAGKGVVIQASYEDACASLGEFFSGKFGDAGNVVVIEEYLGGGAIGFCSYRRQVLCYSPRR